MGTHAVQLEENEQIVFENDQVVLTSKRILANFRPSPEGERPRDHARIKDIATVQKIVGGQENRMRPGLRFLAAGAVLVVVEVFAPLPGLLDRIVFFVGAACLAVGGYMVLSSTFRVKPHTTLLFVIFGRKDIIVSFQGRENPEADKLTNAFNRVKRAL